MDCDGVIENLFIGPYPLDRQEIEQLRSAGITAILSLQTDEDLLERGVEWEQNAAAAANLHFQNVPIVDFDVLDLQQKLPCAVAVLDRMLKAGYTVYLHCTLGAGRAPTVAAAYLHWCMAWSLERALIHVRAARHCYPDVKAIRSARTSWADVELAREGKTLLAFERSVPTLGSLNCPMRRPRAFHGLVPLLVGISAALSRVWNANLYVVQALPAVVGPETLLGLLMLDLASVPLRDLCNLMCCRVTFAT